MKVEKTSKITIWRMNRIHRKIKKLCDSFVKDTKCNRCPIVDTELCIISETMQELYDND